jgi:hypothetical protein
MLLLFETPAGYALFKVLDEGKLKNVDNIYKYFETADAAQGLYVALYFLFLAAKNPSSRTVTYPTLA